MHTGRTGRAAPEKSQSRRPRPNARPRRRGLPVVGTRRVTNTPGVKIVENRSFTMRGTLRILVQLLDDSVVI